MTITRIYADLIMKSKKTIDDVPDKLKDEVLEILAENGYSDESDEL